MARSIYIQQHSSVIPRNAAVIAASPSDIHSTLSLRSTSFASYPSFSPLKTCHLLRRGRYHHRPPRGKKCLDRISASVISPGMGTVLHESIVRLQVGLLQTFADLGFALPASDGVGSWPAIVVPAVLWYSVATPGSVSGLVDYAYAPVHALSNVSFDAEEVQVGRQIGEGSFGVVYEGYIGRGVRKGSQKKELHVILKKVKPRSKGAEDMHDAEVYMNRRVQRTAPNSCADFLGTTSVTSSQQLGRLSEGLWLVWRYEGDRTLTQYMQQKNFPENVAEIINGSKFAGTSKQEILEQSNAVIRKITIQILTSLRDLHKTGVVHRDVKPRNLILAEDSNTFKLIDLGAAVDLRSGFNYVPDETIMDPIYAAPERHVMPISTPRLPADPICSVVSPFIWLLNTPDRFDLFSAGVVLLQMAVKPLRQDVGLLSFNTEFKRVDYDLDAWRRRCRFSKDEFALLDADDGAGWELLKSLLQPRRDKELLIWPGIGGSRPSASAALRHRYFTGVRSSLQLPSFKNLQLPSLSIPVPPVNLIPKFKFDSLPKLSGSALPKFSLDTLPKINFDSLPKFNLDTLPKLTFDSLPHFSIPQLQPRDLIRKIRFDALPKLSLPFEPGSIMRKISIDIKLPDLKNIGSSIDGRQVIENVGAVMPIATASAVALATSWLVFSAVKESAQTSYAIGQRAVESVGISGAVGITSIVLFRWLLAGPPMKDSTGPDSQSRTAQPQLRLDSVESAVYSAFAPLDGRSAADDLSASQLQGKQEASTVTAAEEAEGRRASDEPSLPQGFATAAGEGEMSSDFNARITKLLLNSGPKALKQKATRTGLTEAVQTMESQLASLESSIAAERLFAEQQQKQIAQMEKLLKQRPREAALAGTDQPGS